MRVARVRFTLRGLMAAVAVAGLAMGGVAWYVGPGRRDDGEIEGRVPRLPVLPADARAWIALEEARIKPPSARITLGEAIRAAGEASRGKDGRDPPIEFHLDPESLRDEEVTPASPVEIPADAPGFGAEGATLRAYLALVVRQVGLSWHVQNGLVVIARHRDDAPPYQTATAAEARTWLVLHEVVPLRFPDGAPLSMVLDSALGATAGRGRAGHRLRFVHGERSAEETRALLSSPVSIALERAPLGTSLALVLGQVGHSFRVQDDGSILIRDAHEDRDEMDEAMVFDSYRVSRWAESIPMQEALAAERNPRPAGHGFGADRGK